MKGIAPNMAAKRSLVCIFFFLLPSVVSSVQAETTTHHHEWDISPQLKAPDCSHCVAATINGRTTAPVIQAVLGDTVVVTITINSSVRAESAAIRWHGIRDLQADGMESVTLCNILAGHTFTFRFVVHRPGTFTYQANYGSDSTATLNGIISVVVVNVQGPSEPEPPAYDTLPGHAEIVVDETRHGSDRHAEIVVDAPRRDDEPSAYETSRRRPTRGCAVRCGGYAYGRQQCGRLRRRKNRHAAGKPTRSRGVPGPRDAGLQYESPGARLAKGSGREPG